MIIALLLGFVAGAVAAVAHLAVARLRAQLATRGRGVAAAALYPVGLAVFAGVVVLALRIDGRAALGVVLGMWLARTLVLARVRAEVS